MSSKEKPRRERPHGESIFPPCKFTQIFSIAQAKSKKNFQIFSEKCVNFAGEETYTHTDEEERGMRVVVQRVAHASVTIGGERHSEIRRGLLILLGVGREDEEDDVDYLVKKVVALRIFNDAEGVMNLSVVDTGGDCMVVSQFTLMASTRKGNRPSYIRAAAHEKSIPMYELFVRRLSEALQRPVATGEFGADMKVELLNDGPVTIIIDSRERDF